MKTRILLLLITILSMHSSSLADDQPFKDDWIVRLQAEKLDRQFAYTGTTLDKIGKVTVDYYPEINPDNKTKYEMLWFNDGKPIGLERLTDYKVPAGKTTKMEIENKKDTSPESEKAAADAILRVSLDAFQARTPIVSIKVPQESYQGIVDAMHELHCVESDEGADEAKKALMNFPIETDNNGPSTILYFIE